MPRHRAILLLGVTAVAAMLAAALRDYPFAARGQTKVAVVESDALPVTRTTPTTAVQRLSCSTTTRPMLQGYVPLEGTILESSHVPLAAVLVRVVAARATGESNAELLTHTDATGFFTLSVPADSPLLFLARKQGYAPYVRQIIAADAGLTIQVVMTAGSALRGRLLRLDDGPLPRDIDADFVVSPPWSASAPVAIATTRVAIDGFFEFPTLPHGHGFVSVLGLRVPALVPTTSEVIVPVRQAGSIVGTLRSPTGEHVPHHGLTVAVRTSEGFHAVLSAPPAAAGDIRVARAPTGRIQWAIVRGKGFVVPPAAGVASGETLAWDPTIDDGKALFGTVLSEESAAVPGAVVTVLPPTWDSSTCSYVRDEASLAVLGDESGRFTLQGLHGFASIRAESGSMMSAWHTVGDEAVASPLVLRLAPRSHVRLRAAVDWARLFIDDACVALARRDERGELWFPDVEASDNAYVDTLCGKSALFSIPAGVVVTVDLEAHAEMLRGTVRDAIGRPIRGAFVRTGTEEYLRLALEVDQAQSDSGAFVATDDRGDFALRMPQHGQMVALGVVHEDYVPLVRSVPVGAERFEACLERGVALQGVVLGPSGRPVAAAEVTLVGKGAGGVRRQRLSRTRADGSFSFAGLAVGEYKLFAASELGELAGVAARAGEGDTVLRYEHGGTIRGVVLDDHGVPVAGAVVNVNGRDMYTDRGGGFCAGSLPEGYHAVRAEDESGRCGEITACTGADVVLRIRSK